VARFEDRLFSELVEQHGALLVDAPPAPLAPAPARRPRTLRRRAPALVTAGLALAAALAAIVIGIGSHGGGTPAYAVVVNANGTVTVTISELVGISGADARLRALGLPVRVVPASTDCPTYPGEFPRAHLSYEQMKQIALPSGPYGAMVITPSAIPQGVTVVIGAREEPASSPALKVAGLNVAYYEGTTTPTCLKF
jgi:hypothetical protein